VLDSLRPDHRRRAIPAKKKSPSPPKRPASRAKRPAPRRPAAPKARREQPLGAGVGDSFAVRRLKIPPQQSRARPQERVREISWAEFGEIAREMGETIRKTFQPQAVLGVVNGGLFIGGTLAAALQADFHPVRFARQGRPVAGERPPALTGKRVLVVDDVTVSGQTLSRARALAKKAGAAEVRSAALVMRPGRSEPDFYAIRTDQLVVFGWDYQLHADPGAAPVDPGEVGV